MARYLGGKSKHAKAIAEQILATGKRAYLEPFLGSAAVAARVVPHMETATLADASEDLMLMWEALATGWEPPTEVSRDLYASLRDAEPSALRGFVGFHCSFGGKWYGGLASGGGRNYAAEAARSLKKTSAPIRRATLVRADYRTLSASVTPGTVVYADPPYAGTTAYGAVAPFDAGAFWQTMGEWAERGASVLVSEYEAPAPWLPVWEKDVPVSVAGGAKTRARATERLWSLPEESHG